MVDKTVGTADKHLPDYTTLDGKHTIQLHRFEMKSSCREKNIAIPSHRSTIKDSVNNRTLLGRPLLI